MTEHADIWIMFENIYLPTIALNQAQRTRICLRGIFFAGNERRGACVIIIQKKKKNTLAYIRQPAC